MRRGFFTIFLFMFILGSAQNESFKSEDASLNPWTNLNFADAEGNFNFAILADRTGNCRPGVFSSAIDKLNLLQPEFVISVGDLIEGNTYNKNEIIDQWKEADSLIAKLEMPLFVIPGNHDYDNEVMASVWEQRYGKPYSFFVYKDVLFLLLNSQDGKYGHISEQQIEFIKDTLSKYSTVRHTFVFIHQPLWKSNRLNGWKQVETLLAPRKHTVFCGHTHIYSHTLINNQNYINLATTGGGHGDAMEEAARDHVAWVSMKDLQPRFTLLGISAVNSYDYIPAEKLNLTEIELNEGVQMNYLPLYFDKQFKKEESVVQIENNTDFTVSCQLIANNNEILSASLSSNLFDIPAHTIKEIPFSIKAKKVLSEEELFPLDFVLKAEVPGKASVEKSVKVQPVRKYYVDRVAPNENVENISYDKVAVEYHQYGTTTKKKQDNSFLFYSFLDEKYLYVSIHVVDSQLVKGQEGDLWGSELLYDFQGKRYNTDCIEIRLDAKADPARAQNNGWDAFNGHFMAAVEPSKDKDGVRIQFQDKLPKGFNYYYVRLENGYFLTCYFPLDYLKEMQGDNWDSFRLNIVLHNRKEDGSFTRSSWYPDWRSKDNIVGSGTFFVK